MVQQQVVSRSEISRAQCSASSVTVHEVTVSRYFIVFIAVDLAAEGVLHGGGSFCDPVLICKSSLCILFLEEKPASGHLSGDQALERIS
ncbi:hypothetical protein SRHO_G00021080 [Serrasalmus rhombeus]